MAKATIRLPSRFFDDHFERGLDTPGIVKRTQRHVWIYSDDSAIPELQDDADYYRDTVGVDPSYFGLCRSAKRTWEILEASQVHPPKNENG